MTATVKNRSITLEYKGLAEHFDNIGELIQYIKNFWEQNKEYWAPAISQWEHLSTAERILFSDSCFDDFIEGECQFTFDENEEPTGIIFYLHVGVPANYVTYTIPSAIEFFKKGFLLRDLVISKGKQKTLEMVRKSFQTKKEQTKESEMNVKELIPTEILKASFGFDRNRNHIVKKIPINIECHNLELCSQKFSFFENTLYAISSQGEAITVEKNVQNIEVAKQIALQSFKEDCRYIY